MTPKYNRYPPEPPQVFRSLLRAGKWAHDAGYRLGYRIGYWLGLRIVP